MLEVVIARSHRVRLSPPVVSSDARPRAGLWRRGDPEPLRLSPVVSWIASLSLAMTRSSRAQNRLAPQVERMFLVRPFLRRPVVDHFQFGRHFDPIAVGVDDEDEQIIAGPM